MQAQEFLEHYGILVFQVRHQWTLAYPKDEYHEDFGGARLYLYPTSRGPRWRPHKVGIFSALRAEGLRLDTREAALLAAKWWWESDAMRHYYKKWLALYRRAWEEGWYAGRAHKSRDSQ